jgi:hypothetical protein
LFPSCERDLQAREKSRDLQSCFECVKEQRAYSAWAKLPAIRISQFISAQEAALAKRELLMCSAADLENFRYAGEVVADCAKHSLISRGLKLSDKSSAEKAIRDVFLATMLMLIASKNYFKLINPDLILLADGVDNLTAPFKAVAVSHGARLAQFRWDAARYGVMIQHPDRDEFVKSEFLLENVSKVRSEPATWPAEITSMAESIVKFLGIEMAYQALPVASH